MTEPTVASRSNPSSPPPTFSANAKPSSSRWPPSRRKPSRTRTPPLSRSTAQSCVASRSPN